MFDVTGLMMLAAWTSQADPAPQSTTACAPSTEAQITVCADRPERSPYRIDPAISAVQRNREDRGSRPSGHQFEKVDPCPPHGLKLCPGIDTIPVLAIARVAAASALLAAQGEDWRLPLRTQADEYSEYRAEKAKQERRSASRKPRIGIGLGR